LLARASGGVGFDTLVFADTGMNLDFTALGGGSFDTIEAIDLGGMVNTITLYLNEVISVTDADNELRIDGGAGDVVDLDVGNWVLNANGTAAVNNDSYNVYEDAGTNTTLLVDTDISVI